MRIAQQQVLQVRTVSADSQRSRAVFSLGTRFCKHAAAAVARCGRCAGRQRRSQADCIANAWRLEVQGHLVRRVTLRSSRSIPPYPVFCPVFGSPSPPRPTSVREQSCWGTLPGGSMHTVWCWRRTRVGLNVVCPAASAPWSCTAWQLGFLAARKLALLLSLTALIHPPCPFTSCAFPSQAAAAPGGPAAPRQLWRRRCRRIRLCGGPRPEGGAPTGGSG